MGVTIATPRVTRTAKVDMNAPANQLGTSSNMMVKSIIVYLTEYYRNKISEIAIPPFFDIIDHGRVCGIGAIKRERRGLSALENKGSKYVLRHV
jgi:hypothetical protein